MQFIEPGNPIRARSSNRSTATCAMNALSCSHWKLDDGGRTIERHGLKVAEVEEWLERFFCSARRTRCAGDRIMKKRMLAEEVNRLTHKNGELTMDPERWAVDVNRVPCAVDGAVI